MEPGSCRHVDIEFVSAYPIQGDFNRDYEIGFYDFSVLTSNWLEVMPAGFKGDLDLGRDVDIDDLEIFARYWLE